MPTYLGKSQRVDRIDNHYERIWLSRIDEERERIIELVGEDEFQGIYATLPDHATLFKYWAVLNRERERLEQETSQDCNCVLPEQNCPVCRATARRVYGREL